MVEPRPLGCGEVLPRDLVYCACAWESRVIRHGFLQEVGSCSMAWEVGLLDEEIRRLIPSRE
jgi:hypothetical protein